MSSANIPSLQALANSIRQHGRRTFVDLILQDGSKGDVFMIEDENPLDDGELPVKYIIDEFDPDKGGFESHNSNDDRYWNRESLSEVNILQYIPAGLASRGNWKPGDVFYTRNSQSDPNEQRWTIVELPSNLKPDLFIRTMNPYNRDWTTADLERANIIRYEEDKSKRGGSIKHKRKVKRKRSMRERRRGLKKTLKRKTKKI